MMSQRGSSNSKRFSGRTWGKKVAKAAFSKKRYVKQASKTNSLSLQFNKLRAKFRGTDSDENSVGKSIIARKVFSKLPSERRRALVENVAVGSKRYKNILDYVVKYLPNA